MTNMPICDYHDLKAKDVALIGICSDHNSSFMQGPAKAPVFIREALFCGSANLSAENGVSIRMNDRFKDLGDRLIHETEQDFLNITSLIEPIMQQKARPLTLGGDHAITYPVFKAVADVYGPINILHFDAHLDLYPHYEGNVYSHACPFARIMEQKLAKRLVQVGIRTLNGIQQKQVDRFGVEVHEMRYFNINTIKLDFSGPLYISIDIDALDPAFAPGVSHFEPGGLSVRDILTLIQAVNVPVVGADIVEYNPDQDTNGMTAMVAAKFVKELTVLMLN